MGKSLLARRLRETIARQTESDDMEAWVLGCDRNEKGEDFLDFYETSGPYSKENIRLGERI